MWAALFTLDIKWIILQPYSFALSQDQTYPVCVLGLESKPINHSQQFLCAIQLNRWTKFTLKIFVDLMALLLKRLPSTWLVFSCVPSGQPEARSCSSAIAKWRSSLCSLPAAMGNNGCVCYLFGISEQPLPSQKSRQQVNGSWPTNCRCSCSAWEI